MFGFLSMIDNYEQRLVANTKVGSVEIDTVSVNDSDQPYETGIKHPQYNDGDWVIVEMYDSKDEAEEGHKRWVDVFSADILPAKLEDKSTCGVIKFIETVGGERKTHEKQD